MNAVKINRLQLLGIVCENMAKHVAEFNESVEDYKTLSVKIAEANVKIAKQNLKLAEEGDMDKLIPSKGMPIKPTSYEDSYKRAIRMLELSVEEVIEVEEDIFNQLVLDEWTWKRGFVATGALYKSIL